jgi:hypothetical protein
MDHVIGAHLADYSLQGLEICDVRLMHVLQARDGFLFNGVDQAMHLMPALCEQSGHILAREARGAGNECSGHRVQLTANRPTPSIRN